MTITHVRIMVVAALLLATTPTLGQQQQQQQQTLMQARTGHGTKLVPDSYEPDGAADVPPTSNPYVKVKFASKAGQLVAYLTPDAKDGKKRPAIVWAHGGFGGIGEYYWSKQPASNDQTPRAFLDAGFVVMLPSWRGENENPGKFELFYGEVDDAVAAVEYVSTLPYVDASRIYFGGHSTGGTITLLTALSSDKVRAAFSFGGAPDMGKILAAGGYGNTPFDPNDPKEARLRSATHFVNTLVTPTWYFEGSVAFGAQDAAAMQQRADDARTPFKSFIVDGGNHFDILRPLTALVAAKCAADTGAKCSISITEAEVTAAFDKSREGRRQRIKNLPLATLTPAAAQQVLLAARAEQIDPAKLHLRITEEGGLDLTEEVDPQADEFGESQGVKVAMSKELAPDHRGIRIDYADDARGKGFKLLDPPEAKE